MVWIKEVPSNLGGYIYNVMLLLSYLFVCGSLQRGPQDGEVEIRVVHVAPDAAGALPSQVRKRDTQRERE